MAPRTIKLAIPLFASLLQASAIDKCPMLSKRADGVINNPPSNDAFYLPPSGFEASPPGDVLNIRHIGEKSSVMGSMYQILYRTADTLGNPQAAVTTVWVPQNGTNQQLLSYQTPYDSVNPDCVPSFAVRDASTPESIGPFDAFDVATINAALANGWYVSMPDYNGPQAAFGSGPQAAQATLDGIRAVLGSTDCTGISPAAQVAMYGHSAGAHATEWAAEYKKSYAPELDIVGAALGGLAPKLMTVLSETNDGPYASYGPAILLGLSNAYPTVKQWLYQSLVPAKADYFFDLEHVCGAPTFFEWFAGQDITSYFNTGIEALNDDRYLAAVGGSGIMGRMGPPAMPLLVFDATNDHVSPVADTEDLVSKYCSEGGSVDYVETSVGGHLQTVAAAADAAMTWIGLAFAGERRTGRCRSWKLTDSTIEPFSISASTSAFSKKTSSTRKPTPRKSSSVSSKTKTDQTKIYAPAASYSASATLTMTASRHESTGTSTIDLPSSSSSTSGRTTTLPSSVQASSSSSTSRRPSITLTSTIETAPLVLPTSRRMTTLTSTVEAPSLTTSSRRRTTTLTTTVEATVEAPLLVIPTSRRTTTLTSTVEAATIITVTGTGSPTSTSTVYLPYPARPLEPISPILASASNISLKRRTTTLTTTVQSSPAPATPVVLSVSWSASATPRVRIMASSRAVESPQPTPQVTTMVSCKTLTSTLPYMTVSCQTKLVNGPVSGAFKPSAAVGPGALVVFVITVTTLAFTLV